MLFSASRGYDAHFLMRKILGMKCTPQLIMDGTKILSMIVENLHYLDSVKFLPVSLKSKHNSLDLTILTKLTRPTIWIMWAPILNPSYMGKTICQAMREHSI